MKNLPWMKTSHRIVMEKTRMTCTAANEEKLPAEKLKEWLAKYEESISMLVMRTNEQQQKIKEQKQELIDIRLNLVQKSPAESQPSRDPLPGQPPLISSRDPLPDEPPHHPLQVQPSCYSLSCAAIFSRPSRSIAEVTRSTKMEGAAA